jgi:chromosome segregation ATPase
VESLRSQLASSEEQVQATLSSKEEVEAQLHAAQSRLRQLSAELDLVSAQRQSAEAERERLREAVEASEEASRLATEKHADTVRALEHDVSFAEEQAQHYKDEVGHVRRDLELAQGVLSQIPNGMTLLKSMVRMDPFEDSSVPGDVECAASRDGGRDGGHRMPAVGRE